MLRTLILASFCVAVAFGACIDASSSCSVWAANGFCTNSQYTEAQRAQYCGSTCSLCAAAASSACADTAPTNICTAWKNANFCAGTAYSKDQKSQYCKVTCGLC